MKLEKFFRYSLAIGITGAVINLILFATNIYYNLVIPIFEKSMDDGPAFTFIDDLTFYTPLIFMALFLAYLIAGQVYLKIHREKKEDEVTEKLIDKNAGIQKALDDKAEFLKHKYYTNCPKCGAVREENTSVCSFCGTSLLIEKKKRQ